MMPAISTYHNMSHSVIIDTMQDNHPMIYQDICLNDEYKIQLKKETCRKYGLIHALWYRLQRS